MKEKLIFIFLLVMSINYSCGKTIEKYEDIDTTSTTIITEKKVREILNERIEEIIKEEKERVKEISMNQSTEIKKKEVEIAEEKIKKRPKKIKKKRVYISKRKRKRSHIKPKKKIVELSKNSKINNEMVRKEIEFDHTRYAKKIPTEIKANHQKQTTTTIKMIYKTDDEIDKEEENDKEDENDKDDEDENDKEDEDDVSKRYNEIEFDIIYGKPIKKLPGSEWVANPPSDIIGIKEF